MNEDGRVEELRQWLAEASADFKRAQADVAAAQQRVEACRERIRLLERLMAVEGCPHPEFAVESAKESGPADEILDACEALVQSAGRPLHISELHAALLKEGTPIPGRGTEANLLVRLHRSNGRFVRTGRGT